MTQDLQHLLEIIQREGVDKAKIEADLIVEGARTQARSLIDAARVEAAKITTGARVEAEAFEHRAEETIRQSARDALLNVEKAVTVLLTNLLLKDVNTALNCTELVAGLVVEAVRAYIGGKGAVEVAAASTLADALRMKLGAEAANGVTVVTDEATGAGFRIRIANGRVEHTFTGAAVADSLVKQLRPRLAALMRAN
jgi:V/A-type H+-transporting ATPase subunit E